MIDLNLYKILKRYILSQYKNSFFMKKFIFLLLTLLSFNLFSQIEDPVDWSFSIEHLSDDIYNLVIEANIEKGWNVYSQHVDPDGPIPTSFSFFSSADDIEGLVFWLLDATTVLLFSETLQSNPRSLAS